MTIADNTPRFTLIRKEEKELPDGFETLLTSEILIKGRTVHDPQYCEDCQETELVKLADTMPRREIIIKLDE